MRSLERQPVSELIQNKELFKSSKQSSKKSDGPAGPGLPAEAHFIHKALEEFDLPPVPDSSILERRLPEVDRLLGLAETLVKHKEVAEAKILLRQALTVNSYDQRAVEALVNCLSQTDEAQVEKFHILDALCRARPSFSSHLRLAQASYDRCQFDYARQNLEQAFFYPTEEQGLLFDAHKLTGNIALQRGDYESAEEAYNKAFSINSHSATLLVNFGTLEVQRLDWNAALQRFQDAVREAQAKEAEVKAKALVGLYLVSRDGGVIPEDVNYLREALRLNPSLRTGVHLLCLWAHQNNESKEALAALERYMAIHPFDEEMGLIFAQFLAVHEDVGLALIELEKIVLWNPQNREAAELLSQLESVQFEGLE